MIPLFYYYDDVTGEEGYVDAEPFVVGDSKELAYDFLPVVSYLYGFSIIDYSGNETYSEFVEFILEE